MEWINLSIKRLAEADYRRSSIVDRGVWLTLLGYCVQQENLGRVAGAESWCSDECRDVLGVPREALAGTHLLWRFADGDLLVSGYPVEKQREVEAKRRAGRKGNRIRWKADSQTESQSDSLSESGKGKRRGIGNRNEGEEIAARRRPGTHSRPTSLGEVSAYFEGRGGSEAEAEKFFDHFEANGWRQGGRTELKDWRAAGRNWLRRARDFTGGAGAKIRASGPAAEFDATKLHAHTGGLPILNEEETARAAMGSR